MPALHSARCPKDWHCCPAAGCSLRPLEARSQLYVTTARWVHAQHILLLLETHALGCRPASRLACRPRSCSRCPPLPTCFTSIHFPPSPSDQVVLYVGGFTKPDLQLFSAAGLPLGRVLWDSRARVVAAGWTKAEQLLVVDDAAQVRLQ